MGSLIELNDTLRITKKQGFPQELVYEEHLQKNFRAEDFTDKIFEFKDKEKIRVYQQPPVRCFLVEDINGKWLYWGLCHVVEIKHDYLKKVTSGKYKIIYINTPEEMKKAHELIDRNKETDFFAK